MTKDISEVKILDTNDQIAEKIVNGKAVQCMRRIIVELLSDGQVSVAGHILDKQLAYHMLVNAVAAVAQHQPGKEQQIEVPKLTIVGR